MSLSRAGQRKLEEWVALLHEQGWNKSDKQWLVDYWLENHDEDGKFLFSRAAASSPEEKQEKQEK